MAEEVIQQQAQQPTHIDMIKEAMSNPGVFVAPAPPVQQPQPAQPVQQPQQVQQTQPFPPVQQPQQVQQTQQPQQPQQQQPVQQQQPPNAYETIIQQQQEQINALIEQTNAQSRQIAQMVQSGAQFKQPNENPMLQTQSPMQQINPVSLSEDTDWSLEALASEIGKK